MQVVKTPDKLAAANALVNIWCKDQTVYCNNCGMDAQASLLVQESCCDNPQLGRNIDHLMFCIKENRKIRETAHNRFTSTENKTLRHAVSIPPRLYYALEDYFKKHGEKLFNNNKELHKFMKRFPMLCTCEVV